jgi:hypothetical protein
MTTILDTEPIQRNTTLVKSVDGTEFGITLRDLARTLTPEQMGDLVCNFVNSSGNLESAERMSAAIQQSHRTLQASAIRFMLETLLAYDPGIYVDARNEGAKAVCDRLRRIQNEYPADLFVAFI